MAAIRLDSVSVDFPIYEAARRSLKKAFLQIGMGGRFEKDASQRLRVRALRDISLQLGKGDRLGLVGPNGAGKTTLLRVLSGVYEPTGGEVSIQGTVSAIFDVSLGIDPEATGEENITLRGMFLGLSHKEIESQAQEIAEFTELGDYLRMPTRTYSSGMMLRLAFAVSTSIQPDILLLDEWILAGDAHFMEKAKQRMEAFVGKSNILVLATHSRDILKAWCNKAVYLRNGELMGSGSVDAMLAAYEADRRAR